jgi:YidC/Oxa1 family membrane protein insertase
MIPLNIKQQKSVKLNSVITPEIQAIQKKYANKKDNDSVMQQQAELNAVYQKYGTSPTSGCLPLLIQMPIIFALYAMIACLPNYIDELQEMYQTGAVSTIIGEKDSENPEGYVINSLLDIYNLKETFLTDEETENLDNVVVQYLGNGKSEDIKAYGSDNKDEVNETIYNSFTSIYSKVFGNKDVWTVVEGSFEDAQTCIDDLKALTEEDWEKLESDKQELYITYSGFSESDWNQLSNTYDQILSTLKSNNKKIVKTYSFFTIDLSKSPANGVKLAIIIPILSALTQLLNMKVSMSSQQKTGNESTDSMMNSMKITSYFMCVVSAFFCYTLPAAVGLYWVVSSISQGVIQLLVNRRFQNMDVDDIIKQNVEKMNKKRAKAGLPPNTISTAASVNTRNYQQTNVSGNQNSQKSGVSVNIANSNKGSISDKANLAKKYMDKK